MSTAKTPAEESQPGAPTRAERMRELARKKQREDEKSEYTKIIAALENVAKGGGWQAQFDFRCSEYIKELLKADGFTLADGHHEGDSSCECDHGCSQCRSYSWTIVSWDKKP